MGQGQTGPARLACHRNVGRVKWPILPLAQLSHNCLIVWLFDYTKWDLFLRMERNDYWCALLGTLFDF
jgi:hypothetical protein